MDGIYVAYLTASEGYSAIVFVLRNGRLTGADIGGGTYSGSYTSSENKLVGDLLATMPPGGNTITGATSGTEGLNYTLPFEITSQDIGQGYITLQTPHGSVNAAIRKLQEVP